MDRKILWRIAVVVCGFVGTIICGSVYFGSFKGLSEFLDGKTLFVNKLSLDLGLVVPMEEKLVAFHVHNKFFRPVEIVGGNASCSCAIPENLPLLVPAMSVSTINVRFRVPQNKGGEFIDNHMTLFLSDGQDPLQLRFTARVVNSRCSWIQEWDYGNSKGF